MTRTPRAFDADLGRAALNGFDDTAPEIKSLLEATAGSSPYLSRLIKTHRDWLPCVWASPEQALAAEVHEVTDCEPKMRLSRLRRAKARMALVTALADLSGVWSLEQVTQTLTDFGGLAADLAIKDELRRLITRNKIPGATLDDVETGAGLAIIAMGKMGAGELNYSSDIDLICLFDETKYDQDDYLEVRQAMVRATRNMASQLSERTAEGYVFRTDLRLRPDPAVTPVCIAMEAAERYYESLGRTWERAAYIKARAAAGDIAAGEAFLERLRPFVWRRHLDFAAIEDAHSIRQRIRETKSTGGTEQVQGRDIKLGVGGIREIEFFTQTRQLIAGGRDADLRARGTVEGLERLGQKGWIEPDHVTALQSHYRAHRTLEHRIQMVHDGHTHTLPIAPDELGRVACLMGMDVRDMLEDTAARMVDVHRLTDAFFAPGQGEQAAAQGAAGATKPKPSELENSETVERWATYPSLRSQRAARIFDRLRPELLARIDASAHPDQALIAIDGFLAGLPAGVQLFSMFEANPQLLDLLVDVAGSSPELSHYLSRNSAVFDAVIGGDFFAEWPGLDWLEVDLNRILNAEPDYERQLDLTRAWAREWHFRAGVHHLRGLSTPQDAGRCYADLAQAVVSALCPIVAAQLSLKHGPPPGRGAVVLGMGSLGAGMLNAGSDLDLIVIYDADGQDMSDGRRPLASRMYYARLTQALVTALTAPMSQGRLYEVDMRLRPSGNQGPVATSFASFQEYQTNEAWMWEHLALTKAKVVAGNPELGAEVEAFRQDLIARPKSVSEVKAAVRDMRRRLAQAKPSGSVWATKDGAGRAMDIELLSQLGSLLSGHPSRSVAGGIAQCVAADVITQPEADILTRSYDTYWAVRSGIRLLMGDRGSDGLNMAGMAFLCRSTGFESEAALASSLENSYGQVAAIMDRALRDDEA